jgi:1,4-alpha-glucan branching enzyme
MAGKPKTKKVQFEFLSPEAREVYLAGDFNHWDSSANPMKKDTKGVWKTTLPLRPGRYEYRSLVDGDTRSIFPCGLGDVMRRSPF